MGNRRSSGINPLVLGVLLVLLWWALYTLLKNDNPFKLIPIEVVDVIGALIMCSVMIRAKCPFA